MVTNVPFGSASGFVSGYGQFFVKHKISVGGDHSDIALQARANLAVDHYVCIIQVVDRFQYPWSGIHFAQYPNFGALTS
jgi:hypothetical protein